MKKLNTLFKTMLLLMMCYAPSLHAQFECVGTLYVSLPFSHEYTLFPEDILAEGDLTGYTATLSQSEFNCDDLGPNNVTLTIFENGDPVFTCTSNVIVEDKINPVVVCFAGPTVELDENGEHVLTFEDVDAGSYDGCGPITYWMSPATLNCESDNPTSVTLVIRDGSGNTAACVTDVTWEPYPEPNPNLACNAQVIVTLAFGQEATITYDMILEGGPYGCASQYEVTIIENMVPRPEPIVTVDDTNKVLIAQVTDLNTGNPCWGELIVVVATGCDPVFTICDTECHSAPLGDCSSGHTDTDNVEWPCDIVIETDCHNAELDITPENLLAEGWADAADMEPFIINEYCYTLTKAYYDVVTTTEEGKLVTRNWAIINWATLEIWEHMQFININIEGLFICDTLPWNAPLGDCDSGHTDTDDIEWPADITVNNNCIYPEDLAMNPEVNTFDAEPRLFTACTSYESTYSDVVSVLNDTTIKVDRKWEVIEYYTNQIWSHVQTITVQGNTTSSNVCTMREGGDAIPGVELIPGVVTDETGCHLFENPDGIIVTPVKDSPLAAGVTLLDKILLLEHVLGIRTLSPYQLIAADLSENGIVSTLDAALLDKILDGTFNPTFEHNWKFMYRNTLLPSADISNPLFGHKFIGVKMGDIDNSFTFSEPLPLNDIVITIDDEILNNKEEYLVPVHLGQNKRILGFSAKIKNEDDNIKFLNVTSTLPGFDIESHVSITTGLVTINYIVPAEYMESGLAIPEGSTLFSISLEPTENTILSESLSLETSHTNILKPSNDEAALALSLGWENVIISSVLNPGQVNQLQFYPNPVREEIYFKGFQSEDKGLVTIIDATGRILSTTALQPSLDLQWLENGMYYMTVKLHSGEVYTAPLIKIKS